MIVARWVLLAASAATALVAGSGGRAAIHLMPGAVTRAPTLRTPQPRHPPNAPVVRHQRLVRWRGPVEHLFFHTLIIDPHLAFGHDALGQGFRDYFVTVHEFKAILAQLSHCHRLPARCERHCWRTTSTSPLIVLTVIGSERFATALPAIGQAPSARKVDRHPHTHRVASTALSTTVAILPPAEDALLIGRLLALRRSTDPAYEIRADSSHTSRHAHFSEQQS